MSDKERRKLERLALIKERYRKLVLEPRREIEIEIESESDPPEEPPEPEAEPESQV